jgi:hypothetical protein
MERAMRVIAPIALLLLSAPAFAQAPTATSMEVSRGAAQAVAVHPSPIQPSGESDPFTITCRPPQALPGKRLKGPEVCKTNQVWGQYRRDGMTVAADGVHDVPSERWRTINPAACRTAPVGGGGTSNLINTTFSPVCD